MDIPTIVCMYVWSLFIYLFLLYLWMALFVSSMNDGNYTSIVCTGAQRKKTINNCL